MAMLSGHPGETGDARSHVEPDAKFSEGPWGRPGEYADPVTYARLNRLPTPASETSATTHQGPADRDPNPYVPGPGPRSHRAGSTPQNC
ncbi:hypothetical protein HJC99_03440 [Candidatus Saccharibacteria bacterium]|nr:hypothetical protein [Candidatus Saccharibacteria bacterium]